MSQGDASQALRSQVAQHFDRLSPSEQKVARYLVSHIEGLILSTAGDIGRSSETSDATVVRTVKKLGYAGLPDLKSQVGQDMIASVRPDRRLSRRIRAANQAPDAITDKVFAEAVERLQETARLLEHSKVVRAVDLIHSARVVHLAGVGPSGLAASYLALRLLRIGRETRVTTATGFSLSEDLLPIKPGDVVILYISGRTYREVDVLLDYADSTSVPVVLIGEGAAARLANRVAVVIEAVQSPSGLTGSPLPAFAVSDVLLVAIAARDEERAVENSETLNRLRAKLTGHDQLEAQ